MTKVKDISYYLSLPYTTILKRDEEGDVVGRIEELPGCLSHGADEAEAIANLSSLKELWLKDALENSEEIPEPQECEPLPSGKWVQRVPKSLHLQLTKKARSEGVSLNQLVTSMLAQQVTSRTVLSAIDKLTQRRAPVPLSFEHVHGYYMGANPYTIPYPITETVEITRNSNATNFVKFAPSMANVLMEPEGLDDGKDPKDGLFYSGR